MVPLHQGLVGPQPHSCTSSPLPSFIYSRQQFHPQPPPRSLANQSTLPTPTDQWPASSLLTCAVVGGTPKNTITHLDLDTVTQGWAQRWRQWFLGAWLFEKFCQCSVEKGRCGRDL